MNLELSKADTNALENWYAEWQIEEAYGSFRYQARERGHIVAFYGYADTYAEALERLLSKAERVGE
jgi:hypothetical protein